jgi:hypothetical protein
MAITLSIREKIMVKVKENLEQISRNDDYSYDVRQVTRTNSELPDHPPLPSIFVYEGEEDKQPLRKTPNQVQCTLPIAVVYVAEDYSETATTANAMLTDVVRAMGSSVRVGDADAPTRYQDVEIYEMSNEIVIDDVNNPIVYVVVNFELYYYHSHGDLTKIQV